MEKLPHLKFIDKIVGKPRLHGGGKPDEKTQENKENRGQHSRNLHSKISSIKDSWQDDFEERSDLGLAKINKDTVPVFLQINPSLFNDNKFNLEKYGIEIISEEEDGFIIGSSIDGFQSLEEKIRGFIDKEHGTGKIADFWKIVDGNRREWKPKNVLSEDLYKNWNKIFPNAIYKLEVGIAFGKPVEKEPVKGVRGYESKYKKFLEDQIERDDELFERQDHFDEFIDVYGKRISDFANFNDSFSCEVEINGKGLKDLAVNYPFVFEVNEVEQIQGIVGSSNEFDFAEIEITAPDDDCISIGVIDSGVAEGNKYIESAIEHHKSISYVESDPSTADKVSGGGHGTRVAGAILFPKGVSNLDSPYQLPFKIRNLKVLDNASKLQNKYPAKLMEQIVQDNEDCTIYNLSINSKAPYRIKHMSSWASTLDKLIHSENLLFLVSAGNIEPIFISWYLRSGKEYPSYLAEKDCRIANPGQSCFSIVVGSINSLNHEDDNWISLGGPEDISAFSRIGSGIWGMVKPDVVEYGGGFVSSKNSLKAVKGLRETSPELVRATKDDGLAYGNDSVGTSFSTPKVTFIAGKLRQLYPDENINLIRNLIVQGARLPNEHFTGPTADSIRYFGYGIPSLERVTNNTEQRVTFYNTDIICSDQAHIYSLKIPDSLKDPGNDFEILIEVTLSFTADVRRTRQRTKSYLSTWVDWISSYFDETLDGFKSRALKRIEDQEDEIEYEREEGRKGIKWKIRKNKIWGDVKDFSRNNSSLQKDWAIIKAYELSDEISFSVQGHKGWDLNQEPIPYAFSVSIEALNTDINVYESVKVENESKIETQSEIG